MIRFHGNRTLAIVVAWAALLVVPDYQSPPLEPAVAGGGPANPDQLTTVGEMFVTAEWFDLIFRDTHQRNEQASRRGSELTPSQGDNRPTRTGGTFKTLCVRLCDGFYFPISYATSRDRFAADVKQCEQRCPARSRLFVHRNPGENVDSMVDLNGRSYRSLPTALLHRTQYIADCTCRGLPWEQDALSRHHAYADAAKKKTASKIPDKRPAPRSERLAQDQ